MLLTRDYLASLANPNIDIAQAYGYGQEWGDQYSELRNAYDSGQPLRDEYTANSGNADWLRSNTPEHMAELARALNDPREYAENRSSIGSIIGYDSSGTPIYTSERGGSELGRYGYYTPEGQLSYDTRYKGDGNWFSNNIMGPVIGGIEGVGGAVVKGAQGVGGFLDDNMKYIIPGAAALVAGGAGMAAYGAGGAGVAGGGGAAVGTGGTGAGVAGGGLGAAALKGVSAGTATGLLGTGISAPVALMALNTAAQFYSSNAARSQAEDLYSQQKSDLDEIRYPNANAIDSARGLGYASIEDSLALAKEKLDEELAARGMTGGYAASRYGNLKRDALRSKANFNLDLTKYANTPTTTQIAAQSPTTTWQENLANTSGNLTGTLAGLSMYDYARNLYGY